ncbi:WD domain protein [Thermoascus aurantiacus ATCC 26904]
MDSVHALPEVPRSDPVHLPSSQDVPSSPPSVVSEDGARRKPKKPPPVTPRSFRRFFTPRSALNAANNAGSVKTSRQALKEIRSPALNRLGPAFTKISNTGDNRSPKNTLADVTQTPCRKRKLSFSSPGSPQQSSPLRKVHVASHIHDDREVEKTVNELEVNCATRDEESKSGCDVIKTAPQVKPIRRSVALQTSGELYMRSVTGSRRNKVILRSNYGTGWQDQTSDFYTRPEDLHSCISFAGDHLALPFCTASCNTNSLVAVGDEEGGIRLLESAKNDKTGFSKSYLTFRPHVNAIMDLEFSSDDKLLATASGDQTTLVIDMTVQKPIYCLSNHVSSVKRVQFQPTSNDKVIATCSRDGNVNIWDLRCKGYEKPALQVRCSLESDVDQSPPSCPKMKYPQVLNSIHGAHAWMPPRTSTAERSEPQTGRADITVTSLAFLPPGRENLFVTASEANACVRLWDLRTSYNIRRGRPVPLSTTREPDSHVKYRRFGLTSIAFGGDGSRLYTLCRDGTVYAHSTSHLILGHAPELSLNNAPPRRSGGPDKEGLGPLYGFRHPRLQVASFYVKLAVRKAIDDKGEIIAVGSSDHCAILFPTDERFHHSSPSKPVVDTYEQAVQAKRPAFPRAGLRRTSSGVGLSGRLEDTIPIYTTGTALIEGHKKEVSAVSWTVGGELITVSDDYTARCWREGPDARDLRTGGETEGRRWHCGWADTKDSYDDEEE